MVHGKELLQKILRKPNGVCALTVLLVLALAAVGAEFFAPYYYDREHREVPYHPPSRIHFRDMSGRFHLRPFVYQMNHFLNDDYARVYYEDTTRPYSLRFFLKGDAYKLWGLIPWDRHLFGVEAPGRIHIFGADMRGRDLFSRLLLGARISLSIGIIGVIIALCVGTVIGAFAGYVGRNTDQIIMRLAEFFMMVPTFYLLLAIRSALPPHLSSFHVYFLVTCILSVIGWAGLARIIRGMVLSLREREYVLAARLSGLSHLRVITRHIIPHTSSYLLVVISVSIPGYIVGESALSLLGLGIQEPFVSWGMLLADALSVTQLKFHPWMLMPGLFIFLTILSFNILGDALRDIIDPHAV